MREPTNGVVCGGEGIANDIDIEKSAHIINSVGITPDNESRVRAIRIGRYGECRGREVCGCFTLAIQVNPIWNSEGICFRIAHQLWGKPPFLGQESSIC